MNKENSKSWTPPSKNTEKIIHTYASQFEVDAIGSEKIEKFCKKQKRKKMTLWRGQVKPGDKSGDEVIYPAKWVSGSSKRDVAEESFTDKKERCCLFQIHLLNVPVFRVNDCMINLTNPHAHEEEYIYDGTGTYYKDKDCNEEGFLSKGAGEYETWYTLTKKKKHVRSEENMKKVKNALLC